MRVVDGHFCNDRRVLEPIDHTSATITQSFAKIGTNASWLEVIRDIVGCSLGPIAVFLPWENPRFYSIKLDGIYG